MANYFIGDIQGCYQELRKLLAQVDFNPSVDQLWAVGDLIARGPGSLEVVRFFADNDGAVHTVLGNHDLHLFAVHGGLKKAKPSDNLSALLNAPDIKRLIDYLRQQPLVHHLPSKSLVVTHAGVPPQWDLDTLLKEAKQVHKALKREDYLSALIGNMYGSEVNSWDKKRKGLERLIYCINALTRMRYLDPDGCLDFSCKSPPSANKHGNLVPWFSIKSAMHERITMIFGHWAALMGKTNSSRFQALDTGCCWGEYLTMLDIDRGEKITQKSIKTG